MATKTLEIGDRRINLVTKDLEVWDGNKWSRDLTLMIPEMDQTISRQAAQISNLQTSLEIAWMRIELLYDTLEKMNNKNCL